MMLFPNKNAFFSGFLQVRMCICTYKFTISLSECQETRFCVVSSPAGQKTGNLDFNPQSKTITRNLSRGHSVSATCL